MGSNLVRLIYTDLKDNHNKFWHGEVVGTNVNVEWGRVGGSPQRKCFFNNSEYAAEKDLEKRKQSKLKKGYTEQYTIGDGSTSKRVTNIGAVAKKQIRHSDPETSALIDFLVARNIHAIEGLTSIRFENGMLTTPLGPVTIDGINKAEILLGMIQPDHPSFDDYVNNYLRIVPRAIGRRRTDPKEILGTEQQRVDELTLLQSLRAVVTDAEQKSAKDVPQIFQAKLELLDRSYSAYSKIDKAYNTTINNAHSSSKLKLKRVWLMSIDSADQEFEFSLGNIKQLWHGTKDANLLSILKNGYVIASRRSGIAITGRMYGDGLYFSDQSTKSLNYATNFWGGSGSQRTFMIWNDVAMGKEYIPRGGCTSIPVGFDSCFAQARKSGVRNNEMIVYKTSQVKPTYLCEFG